METKPALCPEGLACQPPGAGNGMLISKPTDRGTPRGALVDALFCEDVERCRQLLNTYPELVNTPLQHQANHRVALYDSAWGSTYRGGYQDVTPIVFATLVPRFREKRIEYRALSPSGLAIITLLVEHGAALEKESAVDEWTSRLLIEVCRDYDSPEALDLLVRIGADMHTRRLDENKRTLLQVAADRGALGAVAFLLDRGVPMNYMKTDPDHEKDEDANGTPLHWAAMNGRHQVVRLLLSRGALGDMETIDQLGCTPLVCAASSLCWQAFDESPSRNLNQEETVRLLVDAGADLTASNRQDRGGRTPDSPLGHVSTWGSAHIVRYLASKGSDIHQQLSYPTNRYYFPYGVGGDKVTPLHRGAHNLNVAGVQALLDLGADPDATDGYGRQPIHWAIIGRWLSENKVIHYTLVNASDSQVEPWSSAFSAKLAALESTILQLITHNASIGRQDAFGRTPLHYAAHMKLLGAVEIFIKKGSNPGLADKEGRTILHHLADALYHPHTHEPFDGGLEAEHLRTILAEQIRSTDVNRTDNTGSTALHLAARTTSDAAVALLLGLGADPNLPDGKGSTALHLAARCADWVSLGTFWAGQETYEPREYPAWSRRAARIKALLLGAGADANVRDAQGQTSAEIEEALNDRLRREWAQHLERRAKPRAFGRGRGRGFGRGRGGPPAPVPGNGAVQVGAGHGRGDSEGPPVAGH